MSKPAVESTPSAHRASSLSEKFTIVESPDDGDQDQVLIQDVLSLNALTQWEHKLEMVCACTRLVELIIQDPTLKLSRLVLHNSDPVTTFTSRPSLVHDEKIFNLQLKGLGPKGEYPGPRVNQASSGRCWLFATSESPRLNNTNR